MKIKRFKAKQFSEALSKVKRELGSDAVILSSDELSDGTVEIVAAVDFRGSENTTVDEPSGVSKSELDTLKEEIQRLRDALLELRKSGYELKLPEKKRKLLKMLISQSIREEFAIRLCEGATDFDSLLEAINRELRVFDINNSKQIVMLVGATGSGKTTTLCKLAANEIRKGKRIAIVTLDTLRLGATYQLASFARVLGLPLEVAHNMAEFKQQINKHRNKDRIFVDTSGRNPQERHYIEELKEVYSLDLPVETHLILSTSSDQEFMMEAYKSYRNLKIDCLGFTKIDEISRKGCIYNLSVLYQKPIAYLTNGQRIPKDIIFPDTTTISGLILQKEC